MLPNPQGIGTTSPRLSWIVSGNERNIEQFSYQILAASSLEKLNKGEADLWNTTEVKSNQSVNIPYAGVGLTSRSTVYWKVKVKTNKGESEWSNPASFSIGLLADKDWIAKWIGLDRAFPWDSETQWSRLSARYLRSEFSSKKQVSSAKVYISGLGMYELYINGKKIGNQVLAPAPTNYDKSVLYNTFDVTSNIQNGKNAVGVILGNGRYYNMRQNFKPHKVSTKKLVPQSNRNCLPRITFVFFEFRLRITLQSPGTCFRSKLTSLSSLRTLLPLITKHTIMVPEDIASHR